MIKKYLILGTLPLLFACTEENTSENPLLSVSANGAALPYSVMDVSLLDTDSNSIELRNGGYGSGAAINPKNPQQFFALTDRGPNGDYVDGELGEGKIFPVVDYTPRIGLFEIRDGAAVKIKDILLRDRNGNPVTGLPNSANLGGTGEIPYHTDLTPILVDDSKAYDAETNPVKLDDYGIDSEGLAAMKDGTFWVSDEYGPHMVHFDANGKEIDRINPFSNDTRTSCNLPAEFKKRRANRGMEGLAVTPDQNTLVGIMQSAMYNPDKSVKKTDITRIVAVSLGDCTIRQYLYRQDQQGLSNSEIVALNNDTFIVIERDGDYLADNAASVKKVYKITLSSGTNLEAVNAMGTSQDANTGLMVGGKTLEQVVFGSDGKNLDAGWQQLAGLNITPVSKSLVVDMAAKGYAHDKMEGLVVIDEHHLGILNDDDFAMGSNENGTLFQKYLPGADIDGNVFYVVDADLSVKE